MLVPNWKRVIRYAYSSWLLIIAGVLTAAEAALPFLHGVIPVRPGTFALLTFVTVLAAFWLRLVAQKSVSGVCNDKSE